MLNEKIVIDNFPLCPSNNNLFVASRARGGRFVPTMEYKIFKSKINVLKLRWCFKQYKEKITKWIDAGYVLRVDAYHVFKYDRVWTKEKPATKKKQAEPSRPKSLDAGNRDKASRDGLVTCLEIDDKYFWTGLNEKITCEVEGQQCTIFVISPHKPQQLSDVLSLKN